MSVALGVFWGVAVGVVDVVLLVAMYLICGLGISIGFHRHFSHRSFEARAWLRGTLAILGSMTIQGPVTQWVTDHRKHHALSDRDGDPHSPHTHGGEGWVAAVRGLWHAHMGWLFVTKGMERGLHYGRDLFGDRLIRTIDRMYMLWVVLTLGIPFLVGYLAGGLSVGTGLQALVWGGLVRIFLFQHMTWAVNSICHMFGSQDYRSRDESRNNWAIALATFGEGWHNNHHAFPASAVHGLDRFQFDLSAWIIRGMERLGWVWDVKRPDAAQRARRRVVPGEA